MTLFNKDERSLLNQIEKDFIEKLEKDSVKKVLIDLNDDNLITSLTIPARGVPQTIAPEGLNTFAYAICTLIGLFNISLIDKICSLNSSGKALLPILYDPLTSE